MIRQTDNRFIFGNESVLGSARFLTEDDDLIWDFPELLGAILVQSINRLYNGQPGRATQAMQELLAFADQHRHSICLCVASAGPLSNDDLINWYSRLGFKQIATYIMLRKP